MKIVSVEFVNLNSLAGHWRIDFTDPRYVESGIFAITGPTGAGKSTILDAICLGLFGCTPRLDKAGTASGNEIMTKGTVACMAEVVFETSAGGRYRATWSQHRAHRRADGNLQPPTHQLAEAATGKIRTEKKGETADLVAEITGLDFGRFTKSVMLAQNAFAEFLKMDSGPRAELLEKITGGELYADISREVFARHSAQVATLKSMQATVDGITLLTPDELAGLNAAMTVAQGQVDVAAKQARQHSDALHWLDLIEALVAESGNLAAERVKLDVDIQAFGQDAARLKLAESAARLAGEWQALTGAREYLQNLEKQAADLAALLPGLQDARALADRAVSDAVAAVTRAQDEVSRNVPVIRRARGLDGDIGAAAKRRDETGRDVEKRAAAFDELRAGIDGDRRRIADGAAALAAIVVQLEQTACDATLEARLGEVRLKIEGLDADRGKLSGQRAAQERSTDNLKRIGDEIEGLLKRQEGIRDSEGQAGRDLKGLQERRDEVLRGHDVPWWHGERDRLIALAADVGRALDADAARTRAQDELKGLADQDEKAGTIIAECEKGLSEHGKSVAILDEQLALLNQTRTLQATVRQLSEHRERLRDGVECPLCGSLDHPWAAGNVPTDDETDAKIRKTRGRLDELRRAISECERSMAAAQAGLKSNQVARGRAELVVRDSLAILAGMAPRCGFGGDCPDMAATLKTMLDGAGAALADADAVVDAVRVLDDELATALRRHQECRDGRVQIDNDIRTALVRRDAAADTVTKNGDEIARLETGVNALAAEIAGLVAAWGIGADRLLRSDLVLQELDRRRLAWAALQDRRTGLERDIQSLRSGVAARQGNLERDGAELENARQRLADSESGLQGLRAQRAEALAEPDVDAFEVRLNTVLRVATEARDAANRRLSSAQSELKSVQDRIDTNAVAIASGRDALASAGAIFLEALSQRGFADEASFVAARLADAEMDRLIVKRSELDTRKVELETKTADNAARLAAERARAVTDLDRAAVQALVDQAERDRTAGNRRLGETKNRLDSDLDARERVRDQLEKVQEQQALVRRWEHLNKLIGSADGKNFRQFAQGITFEHLVRNANEHLGVLSDRYSLRMSLPDKNGNASLDLDVVDDWQGGEVRTVRNLSGGETFIVSLALALGLASLASRRIRIDSFFLDEGFGTLDQDALNSAMDALGELRRNNKLIGVISHVEALKERIDTRIQVSRERGGRSTLSGPGVSRITIDE